ncbi:MAG TPA: hypothetical protein VHZ78_07915 [Rhizomicrobium sp.]|jgi:hypothetical protein|nr:hypothetical protein [Rhizomicrobium sp.]
MTETAPRKFTSEHTVGLYTGASLMLPPDQLTADVNIPETTAELLGRCHIYLICRSPALSLDTQTFLHKDGLGSGHLLRKISGKTERIKFRMRMDVPAGGWIKVGDYPHRELLTFDRDGAATGYHFPARWIAQKSRLSDDTARDFEVLYVGQSYGGDGSRTAFTRLQSHSTLQKILADHSAKRPDDELMLFLFEYENQMFTHIDGITKAQSSDEEDTEHWMNILDNPLSEKQQIALAEAGLIRYFEPEYNEIYKSSFPQEQQRILDGCYELDMSAIVVEINTEELAAPLWSPSRGKGLHHIAQYDLHDPDKRRSFFTFVDNEGNSVSLKSDGPVF